MTCLILIKVGQIYPTELQLKANTFDTEALFKDLDLCIINVIVVSKSYDKLEYFDFKIANFPFLNGYFLRSLCL